MAVSVTPISLCTHPLELYALITMASFSVLQAVIFDRKHEKQEYQHKELGNRFA